MTEPERLVERERRIRDAEADRYDAERFGRLGWEIAVVDLAVDGALDLRAGHRVLDAGCGPGRRLPELLARAGDVIGVDLSERSIEVARERLRDATGVQLLAADLRELPLEDGAVDRVLCSEALGSVPSAEMRAAVLRELHRVVRPGGVVVITGYRWLGRVRRQKDGTWGDGLYRYAFTRRELADALRAAGFRDVEVGSAPLLGELTKRLGIPPAPLARMAFAPVARSAGDFVIARALR